jgi:hypothetical protein
VFAKKRAAHQIKKMEGTNGPDPLSTHHLNQAFREITDFICNTGNDWDSPCRKEGQESSQPARTIVKTQDWQKQRTPCS